MAVHRRVALQRDAAVDQFRIEGAVGVLVFLHGQLVQAGDMDEGVLADHRVHRRTLDPAVRLDQLGDREDVLQVEAVGGELGVQQGQQLEGIGDPGAFADPVAARRVPLDPGLDRRQGVAQGQAAVVVHVVLEDHVGELVAQQREHVEGLVRQQDADAVGEADAIGAGVARGGDHADQVADRGARGVFHRGPDPQAAFAGVADRVVEQFEHLLAAHALELGFQRDRVDRGEQPDPLRTGFQHRVDILPARPGVGQHRRRNRRHHDAYPLAFVRGNPRVAALDHIHPQRRDFLASWTDCALSKLHWRAWHPRAGCSR